MCNTFSCEREGKNCGVKSSDFSSIYLFLDLDDCGDRRVNEDSYGFGSTRTSNQKTSISYSAMVDADVGRAAAAGQPKLAVVGLWGLIKQSSR